VVLFGGEAADEQQERLEAHEPTVAVMLTSTQEPTLEPMQEPTLEPTVEQMLTPEQDTARKPMPGQASKTIPKPTVEPTLAPIQEPNEEPVLARKPVPDAVPSVEAADRREFTAQPAFEEIGETAVKQLNVSATAYTTERQQNKITATGSTARVGAIAVDPKIIPYGTLMYVEAIDGSWVYGYATAEDCGGGIKGNKIDLFFDTYDECIQFGVKKAVVYILE
jgi:3D (Asp-Asp-Asp) domain-containing protein